MENKYIPAGGPIGARLMLLTDSPSYSDYQNGKLFTGSEGRQTELVLREAGIDINSCWRSSVSKYFVPPSPRGAKIPFKIRAERVGINLEQQYDELQKEINSVKPNCILALGRNTLYAITGKNDIDAYRGSILFGRGVKVVATHNPSGLLNSPDVEFLGYYNRQLMIFDAKRAKEESQSNTLELPNRILSVCRNSAQLYDFYQRNKRHGKPSIDIEALACIPSCIGIAYTPHEGISVPLWNERGNSSISNSDLVACWQLLAEILFNDVVGQNLKYDEDKLKRIGFIFRSVASDTMLKAFAINPELPKRLAFNTSIYTREPYYKDEGADFDISKQSIDDLFIYNARDACVTKEIDLAMERELEELQMRDYYYNFIMKLHPLYLDIENQGFNVNTTKRDELLKKYVEWDEKLRYELFSIVGTEVNVNSPKQVKSLLFEVFKLPASESTGEDELTKLYLQKKTSDDAKRVIDLILKGRRVRKSISTYMMALPDFDGKMKTTYYIPLETGRTSTGQQDPPIRPTVEVIDENGKKKKKVLGIAFQTMTKHGDIGADIREQYIPGKGEVFVQIDSSQAEARVIFLLANDEEALKLIDKIDYHAHTAVWFFGENKELHNYDKKLLGYEHPIRFCGKTLRHAGHLGASANRAMMEVNTQARKYGVEIQINLAIAENALKIFHQKQPSIRNIFHQGVINSLKSHNRQLRAPVPYGVDAKFGGIRTFFERWGDELFRQAYSYIPQRAVSDNTKSAALRIKKKFPFVKIIMESHDSLLFSILESQVDELVPEFKQEMERPIRFENCSLSRRDLIIPAEIEIGYDYCNFKKFKSGVTNVISANV